MSATPSSSKRRPLPFSVRSSASASALAQSPSSPMVHTPSSATFRRHNAVNSAESNRRREERLKMIHEKQKGEQERKEKAFREHQERLQRVEAQREVEKQMKSQKAREREVSRQRAVLERKKLQEEAENQRRQSMQAAIKAESESRDLQRQQRRQAYAFGSSTPRALAYLNNLDTSQQVYDTKLIATPLTADELDTLKRASTSRSSLDNTRSTSKNPRVAFGSAVKRDETPKRTGTPTSRGPPVASTPSSSTSAPRPWRSSRPTQRRVPNPMTQSVYVSRKKPETTVNALKQQSSIMTQSFTTGEKATLPAKNPRQSLPSSKNRTPQTQKTPVPRRTKQGQNAASGSKKRDTPAPKSAARDASVPAVASPPSTPPDLKRSKSGEGLPEEQSPCPVAAAQSASDEHSVPEEQLIVLEQQTDMAPPELVISIADEQLPGMVAEAPLRSPTQQSEEAAKAALAEKRRIAREEKEKAAEEERIQLEQQRLAEEERRRQEEEEFRRQEEAELRAAEELRRREEERLQLAIEEQERLKREEEKRREEEEEKQRKEEEEARLEQEKATQKRLENEEKLRREQQEREERKQRLSAIMARVGKSPATDPPSSTATPSRPENPPVNTPSGTPQLSATSTKVMQRLANSSGSANVLSSILKRHGSNPNVSDQSSSLMTMSFPSFPTSTPNGSETALMSESVRSEYEQLATQSTSSSNAALLMHNGALTDEEGNILVNSAQNQSTVSFGLDDSGALSDDASALGSSFGYKPLSNGHPVEASAQPSI